jgi:hypothetical protein
MLLMLESVLLESIVMFIVNTEQRITQHRTAMWRLMLQLAASLKAGQLLAGKGAPMTNIFYYFTIG